MEKSEVLLYVTEDGTVKLEVAMEAETVWHNLSQLCEIPVSLQQVDMQQFLTDEWGIRLKYFYKEIGRMQGLSYCSVFCNFCMHSGF